MQLETREQKLKAQLELTRQELHRAVAEQTSLSNQSVLQLSRAMDRLIVEFHRLTSQPVEAKS